MRDLMFLVCFSLIALVAWAFWLPQAGDGPGSTGSVMHGRVDNPLGTSADQDLAAASAGLGSEPDGGMSQVEDGSAFDFGRSVLSKSAVGRALDDQDHDRSIDALVAEANSSEGDTAEGDADDDEPLLFPISGWVLDQNGETVAGMEVTASARRLAQARAIDGSLGGTGSATTDEAGYFFLADLPDGEYLLETEATDSYQHARAVVRTGTSSAVLTVRGNAGAPVTIHGWVTDDLGQPLAGVRVAATDEGGATTTDNAGAFELTLMVDERARTRSIRFTKQDYRMETLDIQQSRLREVAEWPLDAQLEPVGPGAPIQGTVTDEDGNPVAGARVRLSSQRVQRSYLATSAGDGRFAIDDVEISDDYRIWVLPKAGYRDYVEEGLAVERGGLDVVVVLEHLRMASLQGRMINSEGEPVPRYTLWMWNSGAGANKNLAVTSNTQGKFEVDRIPAGDIGFDSRGYPAFNVNNIRLVSDGPTTVDLVLDWGGDQLAGWVESAMGAPVTGATVELSWSDLRHGVTSRSRRRTVSDSNGYFIFTELGPGRHTITVSATGYRGVRREESPTVPGTGIVIQLQETTS